MLNFILNLFLFSESMLETYQLVIVGVLIYFGYKWFQSWVQVLIICFQGGWIHPPLPLVLIAPNPSILSPFQRSNPR